MVFIEGAVDFSIALCPFYEDLYGEEIIKKIIEKLKKKQKHNPTLQLKLNHNK
jgi:hypothetical protein